MFRFKVIIISLITALFCLVISGGIIVVSVSSFFLDFMREDLVFQTETLARMMADGGAGEKPGALISRAPLLAISEIGIFGPDMAAIARFPATTEISVARLAPKDLDEVRAGRTVTGAWGDPTPARRRIFCAAPMFSGEKFNGFVLASANFHSSAARRKKLNAGIVSALVIAFVIATLAGYFMSRWLTAPLRHIRSAILAYSSGDFSARIPIDSKDEIGATAKVLNEMAARIGTLVSAQKDFLADAAHEFKTPLTTIKGCSEAILDGVVKSEADVSGYLGRIREEADGLSALVNDLLEMSRLESGAAAILLAPVMLDGVMNRSIRAAGDLAAAKNVAIEASVEGVGTKAGSAYDKISDSTDIGREGAACRANTATEAAGTDLSGLPAVLADEARLLRVMRNVIENAIRHSPEGGKISARVSFQASSGAEGHSARRGGGPNEGVAPDADRTGRLAGGAKTSGDAGTVAITICDMGPGVPPGLREKVFERFFREPGAEQKKPGGTGLGLSICKKTIEAFGGTIGFIDPTHGFSTALYFTLRAAPKDE